MSNDIPTLTFDPFEEAVELEQAKEIVARPPWTAPPPPPASP